MILIILSPQFTTPMNDQWWIRSIIGDSAIGHPEERTDQSSTPWRRVL